MYRIIHDLRHPTDALQNGLKSLETSLDLPEIFERGFLRMIDSKKFRYNGIRRTQKAAQSIKKFIKKMQRKGSS